MMAVERGVELPVEIGVPVLVGKVQLLDLVLDGLEPDDILLARGLDEISHEVGFQLLADLADITDEIGVDGPHPRALVGYEIDQPLAAQLLQRLAHRIGRHAVALR